MQYVKTILCSVCFFGIDQVQLMHVCSNIDMLHSNTSTLHVRSKLYCLTYNVLFFPCVCLTKNRDIKPQNLLLDPATHVLKLCDFGSAKVTSSVI
jgi:serine/threonine protein kinase